MCWPPRFTSATAWLHDSSLGIMAQQRALVSSSSVFASWSACFSPTALRRDRRLRREARSVARPAKLRRASMANCSRTPGDGLNALAPAAEQLHGGFQAGRRERHLPATPCCAGAPSRVPVSEADSAIGGLLTASSPRRPCWPLLADRCRLFGRRPEFVGVGGRKFVGGKKHECQEGGRTGERDAAGRRRHGNAVAPNKLGAGSHARSLHSFSAQQRDSCVAHALYRAAHQKLGAQLRGRRPTSGCEAKGC